MKVLGNAILAGSLALGGCITDQGQCEARTHQIYVDGDYPEEKRGSCDELAKGKSLEECWRIIRPLREATMSACMTEKNGVTTSCLDLFPDDNDYHCKVEK